jgi:hypothetical protein
MATTTLRTAEPVQPVDVDEIEPLLFDFSIMGAGDSFSGTPAFTCEVIVGSDAVAATRLSGAPQISGLQVVQNIGGLQLGATYLVRCVATMASGLRHTQAMEVPCVRLGQTT